MNAVLTEVFLLDRREQRSLSSYQRRREQRRREREVRDRHREAWTVQLCLRTVFLI